LHGLGVRFPARELGFDPHGATLDAPARLRERLSALKRRLARTLSPRDRNANCNVPYFVDELV
jgi:hypothetical protein